jgi:hypothetical protein
LVWSSRAKMEKHIALFAQQFMAERIDFRWSSMISSVTNIFSQVLFIGDVVNKSCLVHTCYVPWSKYIIFLFIRMSFGQEIFFYHPT